MSGEARVVLAGSTDGSVARLVRAAAKLGDVGLSSYALVGGLAVTCRLSSVHRATQDVDAVTEMTNPSAAELILSTVGMPHPSDVGKVTIDGIEVDVIDTHGISYDDLEGVEGTDRLFVLAHRWSLETAEVLTIEVASDDAHATLPVSIPAGLVAAKTHALATRRAAGRPKRASDIYDIYRLLLAYDLAGEIATLLAGAPSGLGQLVAERLQLLLVDNPERAVLWLSDGAEEMLQVSADQLHDVVDPLCRSLL